MRRPLDRREFLLAGAAAGLLPGCASIARERPALRWEKLPTVPYRGKQDDIAFGTPDRGWYGNGDGRLYRTDDQGDSWDEVWRQPGTYIRALGFWDAHTGILGNVGVGSFPGVTDSTPLYRTDDGGRSWSPVDAISGPVPSGICGIDLVRQRFIDRGERAERLVAHAAGRVGDPAHYLRSTDGGATWTSQDLGAFAAAIYDVKFLGPRTGFLAASSDAELGRSNGMILRSDDGGESWHPVYRSSRPFETVWKLHFPSDLVGYGSLQSYDPDEQVAQRYIVKTLDGGRTWTELPLVADFRWRSFGIGFADERLGWVGGNLGGLETRDGGRSWAHVEMGRAVNKLRFVGSGRDRRAYAIGTDLYRLDL